MNVVRLSLLGMVIALGGCNLAPRYEQPAAPIPDAWPTGAAYDSAQHADAQATPAGELPWQAFITDERLRTLIDMALKNNRDLRRAALNVERTRALYDIQRSELLPFVDLAATGSRQRTPADLSPTGQRTTVEQYSITGGLAWEIDFFGRLRNLEAGALEAFFATREARNSAQLLLIATVADAWFALAADRTNLQLAQTTLESQQSALELVQQRHERGMTPALDVYRAQAQVQTARAAVALYTQRVAQDENALRLLVGASIPEELLPEDLASAAPLQDISAGVSSEVLLYRPDVVAAEHRLRSAYANVGAARAAFFPRISLTAAAGTASSELSGLFESGSGTWAFVPQITMPIFSPRTWAAKRVSEVDQQIALAEYEQTIQTAFREVADALAVRGTVDEQIAAQQALVEAVAETYRLSNLRYERGIDSYLSVLDAQRSLYEAQQNLVILQNLRIANQVRLYAALGGGWAPLKPDEHETASPQ